MNLIYNKDENNLSFTLDTNIFGYGNQVGSHKLNCCDELIGEIFYAPETVHIDFNTAYVTGTLKINSITIDDVVCSCDDNSCSNITGIKDLTDIWPDISVSTYTDTNANLYRVSLKNVAHTAVITVDAVMIQANDTQIVINPSIVKAAPTYIIDAPAEGIHTITIVKSENGVTFSETGCAFVDSNVICVITDYLAKEENKNTNVHLLYNAIKESVACNCNCDDLCILYRSILLELNLLDRCKIC